MGKGKEKIWEELKVKKDNLGGPKEAEAAGCHSTRLEETEVLPPARLLPSQTEELKLQ